LHPDYRKGFMGIKLIKFAEKCLKEDGISVLVINSKTHKPFDAILRRMGYSHIENVFSKRFI
jgi:transketolase C-terminal domain/subunit